MRLVGTGPVGDAPEAGRDVVRAADGEAAAVGAPHGRPPFAPSTTRRRRSKATSRGPRASPSSGTPRAARARAMKAPERRQRDGRPRLRMLSMAPGRQSIPLVHGSSELPRCHVKFLSRRHFDAVRHGSHAARRSEELPGCLTALGEGSNRLNQRRWLRKGRGPSANWPLGWVLPAESHAV